ncbi:related to Zn(II)2Cys6 transcriptional activator [Lecanosticta acicola]|uniref:Related to Zn(II)2Cys6 transcriptional activator n=1 Tax=Lecanosticta acicola TaxID=111012 RepID=A0AAI8W1D0_9PEZI|nr:related to Zn(II)2Cys6 transcriptional activator [Lecanosticta acicola]
MSSQAAGSTVSPKEAVASPSNAVEHKDDDDGWSGEEEEADEAGDGPRKRKRPMSVSYKLEGVLNNQQHLLQHLATHLPGVQAAISPSNSEHGPQAQSALFMQAPDMYPTATPIQYNRLHSQPSNDLGSHQTQHHHHATRPAIQVSPTSAADVYAPSNPPLESPSLNITATTSQDGAMQAVSQDQDFPPYDLLYALTDLFFKHINTWCPILHRRSTLDSLFGPNTLEEADRILLHAIVATTLRFSTDPRLSNQTRERYHATSKQKVLLYGLENSSVKALQALVIIALDTVGSSNGPPGWNLLALITRSVVQLGLAVETTSASIAPLFPSIYTLRAMVLPESRSFIEDESRRRLFWMVYLLDRYATIATAFEFALDDKEIDRKLPCRDDLFARNQPVDTRWFQTIEGEQHHLNEMNHPENLGSFSYYIEIVGILSQIHRFLKKPVDISALSDVEQWQQEYRQLDSKLNQWKFSLPSEYGNMSRLFNPNGGNKIVNCIWIMLHTTYHTTVIRLHSSAAYPTTRSPIFTPSFSAGQRCLTAVEDICALCTYVRSNHMLPKLGPPFAFSLWVAARLLLVHGSTIDHHVNAAIGQLVETLREMGYYWKVAERYATLLQRVLDEYHEYERAPVGENGVRETPSTVKILADMRRCAYDLDFLISRQPRQHFGSKAKPSVTPARTPAPNELEYLDVFDFFNMPRLPFASANGGENGNGNGAGGVGGGSGEANAAAPEYQTFMEYQNMEGNNNNDWLVQ